MNLPELPAGYRWKIKKAYEVNIVIYLEKLTPRWYWKSTWKQVDYEFIHDYVLNSSYTTPEKAVEDEIKQMYEKFMKTNKHVASLDTLVGTYGNREEL